MPYLFIYSVILWLSYPGVIPATPNSITTDFPVLQDTDTTMVDLEKMDETLILDVKYATKDNFTGKVLYPCPKAYLRRPAAKALIEAQRKFKAKGYRIKIFDAYRPISVQWRLWEMYGDPNYVADPRKGSMHNRGAAVDITLVDRFGKELDMGTNYDFFGVKAHTDYPDLPQHIRANRWLLKSIMRDVGYATIKTEWWHFAYTRQKFNISNLEFECP